MALIDDVKVALRVSTDDAGITSQISDLIEEAKLDLCHTADISRASVTSPDALVKGAIKCYCGYIWTEDSTEKERLKSKKPYTSGILQHRGVLTAQSSVFISDEKDIL